MTDGETVTEISYIVQRKFGVRLGEGPHKGEEQLKYFYSTKVFASCSILPIVNNLPAQIEMITSGKSDEIHIHSNKIKRCMYLKIQMYQK